MKNQELQSSLIKSGIILVLCVFFIYAFGVGDSGGVSGTISSLFSAFIFLFGLTLAVAVSIAVMIGIYFGILYLYDHDTCTQTYAEFKDKVTALSPSLSKVCGSKCSSPKVTVVPLQDEDLTPLRQNQNALGSQLTDLQGSIKSIEKSLNTVSASITTAVEEIATLTAKTEETDEALEGKATTAAIDDAAKKLSADITGLQTSVKPLSEKLTELESTIASLDTEEDTSSQDELQQKVDSALNGMQEELTSMKQSIADLASQPQQAKQPESKKSNENTESKETENKHKILAYFTKKADEKKFVALVNEAVAQEMTYAQAGEFLNDSLSDSASGVIADHPSLTKDYIKVCRKKA